MTFKDKLLEDNINEMETKIATLMYLSEKMDTLNEADLQEGVNDFLGKIGMKLHKGDGLLNYIAQFSKGTGKIVLAAFKTTRLTESKAILSTTNIARTYTQRFAEVR